MSSTPTANWYIKFLVVLNEVVTKVEKMVDKGPLSREERNKISDLFFKNYEIPEKKISKREQK